MTALIIFGAILILVILYFLAAEFQKIAEKKGHFERKYLWLSFFFGLVGWLMVVALPDRGVKEPSVNITYSAEDHDSSADTLPDL